MRGGPGRHRRLLLGAGLLAALVAAAMLAALLTDAEPLLDPATVSTDGVDGSAVFATQCARCHGATLQGTETGPPLLHPYYEPGHHPDAAFVTAIRVGAPAHHWSFGAMLPVDGLSDADVAAVIRFIRREQERAGIGVR